MANQIKIRSKLSSGAPVGLLEREIVMNDADLTLYYMAISGLIKKIGLYPIDFVFNELKTGITAANYTLNNTPVAGLLMVVKNGAILTSADFSLAGAVVTPTIAPIAADEFNHFYIK